MGYTPKDILDYIDENDLVSDFMVQIAYHKNGFSIGEITDAKLVKKGDHYRLFSKTYDLNVRIDDEEIVAALNHGLYVSAFISRFEESYNIHFYVHNVMADKKSENEEYIAKSVVTYMIMSTVLKFRLDSPEKVNEYLGK